MRIQALLVELLLSGFFAVACLRARGNSNAWTARALFSLTNRLERLKRTRWQWFSMVLLLVVVRLQIGRPIVAELTALILFLVFVCLPTSKPTLGARTSGV